LAELTKGTVGALRRIHVTRHSPARGQLRCPWWTLAPHDLSLLVRLLGKPQDMNVVYGANGRDVTAELVWGGVRASLDYSTTAEIKRRTWRLETTTTSLELDENSNTWIRNGEPQRLPEQAPLAAELRHFAHCVANRATPLNGIEDAIANVDLLCAGQRTLARSAFHQTTEILAQGSGP
jgi:predicted dehydrogenase